MHKIFAMDAFADDGLLDRRYVSALLADAVPHGDFVQDALEGKSFLHWLFSNDSGFFLEEEPLFDWHADLAEAVKDWRQVRKEPMEVEIILEEKKPANKSCTAGGGAAAAAAAGAAGVAATANKISKNKRKRREAKAATEQKKMGPSTYARHLDGGFDRHPSAWIDQHEAVQRELQRVKSGGTGGTVHNESDEQKSTTPKKQGERGEHKKKQGEGPLKAGASAATPAATLLSSPSISLSGNVASFLTPQDDTIKLPTLAHDSKQEQVGHAGADDEDSDTDDGEEEAVPVFNAHKYHQIMKMFSAVEANLSSNRDSQVGEQILGTPLFQQLIREGVGFPAITPHLLFMPLDNPKTLPGMYRMNPHTMIPKADALSGFHFLWGLEGYNKGLDMDRFNSVNQLYTNMRNMEKLQEFGLGKVQNSSAGISIGLLVDGKRLEWGKRRDKTNVSSSNWSTVYMGTL